jgi:hypothetical protein
MKEGVAGTIQERFLHYETRRAEDGAKRMPGLFGRNDGGSEWRS